MLEFLGDFMTRNNQDEPSTLGKTFGEYFIEKTSGAYLVDGAPTYELAHQKKHDLDVMRHCCESEMRMMRVENIIAAPFYFERVAILARKIKDYRLEVDIIEEYLKGVAEYYEKNGLISGEGVMAGPRYQAISKRLSKAKNLLEKHNNQ
ncbi:hypothetical protein [Pantoea allii]|uniref:hypothetical protein n=1 Tax=Pantoea allii TaxID=574096 RepID=UPI003D7B2FF4